MEAIKQRLQSDPHFRQGFAKQVAKEMHNEQLLETQLAKQVYITFIFCWKYLQSYMYISSTCITTVIKHASQKPIFLSLKEHTNIMKNEQIQVQTYL